MSTEISAYTAPDFNALSTVGATTLDAFRAKVFNSGTNRLLSRLQRDGQAGTVLHLGNQIKTEDVIGKVLTIISVGYAVAPTFNRDGTPVFATDKEGLPVVDENGVAVQKMSTYPVCTFAEAPGWWYNGGSRLAAIIDSLRDECGDEPGDMMLPNTNAELQKVGGLMAYFQWKESTRNPGQRYVDIILG